MNGIKEWSKKVIEEFCLRALIPWVMCLILGCLIFTGSANSRPISEGARSDAEAKVLGNLDILVVAVRTLPRQFLGASLEGTPLKTIATYALLIVIGLNILMLIGMLGPLLKIKSD